MVNVVGADDLAHKALQQIVTLIGKFGTANATDGVGATGALDGAQLFRNNL